MCQISLGEHIFAMENVNDFTPTKHTGPMHHRSMRLNKTLLLLLLFVIIINNNVVVVVVVVVVVINNNNDVIFLFRLSQRL